jgi:hypothetical protein
MLKRAAEVEEVVEGEIVEDTAPEPATAEMSEEEFEAASAAEHAKAVADNA